MVVLVARLDALVYRLYGFFYYISGFAVSLILAQPAEHPRRRRHEVSAFRHLAYVLHVAIIEQDEVLDNSNIINNEVKESSETPFFVQCLT